MGDTFSGGRSEAPQIPPELKGLFGRTERMIQNISLGRGSQFTGPTSAPSGPGFQDIFEGFRNFSGGLFPQLMGQVGDIAQTGGLSREALNVAGEQLAPLFGQQQSELLRSVRAGQGARGQFFSTGGAQQESRSLTDLKAQQGAQTLGSVLQTAPNRLAAALGGGRAFQEGFVTPGLNIAAQGRQPGVQEVENQLALYQLQRPESALPFAISLLGGTPTFQPTFGPGFGQQLIGAIASFFGAGGFGGRGTGR